MPELASPAPAGALTLPHLPHEALAPDLVALFLGATPHPDIVIPEPRVTIADLAAAARSEGTPGTVLRWDAAGQRFVRS